MPAARADRTRRARVVVTDHGFGDLDLERAVLAPSGAEVVDARCATRDDLLRHAPEADALLVQWARIDAGVVERLARCRGVVRNGSGLDNLDLEACARRGIPVCNVPDYCIDEVADHALALALSLARQLVALDRRLRSGRWKLTPDAPMPAFRGMTFAVAGFGRIGREVLRRAAPFGFRRAAYDPLLPEETFAREEVDRLSLDRLFAEADILSLHLPLTPETRRLVDARRLTGMKRTAVLVNTSRGGLVDHHALAEALRSGAIAAAGLDVFDPEPLPEGHPLLS